MELSHEYLVDMEIISKIVAKLRGWEYSWLCLLVLITLVIHLAVITLPSEPMFDEQHYVPDARSIISGDGSHRPEHPPLGKLLITGGILLFGDNPFGWRLLPVFFGCIVIWLFYLICRRLHMSRREASLATFLLSFENMTFVQAGIAMLDVFCLAFMLLCFWLYLKGGYLLSGAAAALAALVKLTGVLALPVIGLHWLLLRRKRIGFFVGGMLLAATLFVLLLPLLNLPVFQQWSNPLDDVKAMLTQSDSIKFADNTHPSRSRPWEWIILPLIMPYWLTPHYLGAISFNIWALILPALAYALWLGWKREKREAALFALLWFAVTYLLWIPLVLITDRVTYVYYFYPVIGSICILLGLGLSHLLEWRQAGSRRVRRIATGIFAGFVLLHMFIFALLGPFSSWLPFVKSA
ncbi:MAG TPA: glycosyltransferase family 39 protein [Dehalococcoidia bacterium]|nr:glycosyltransferase family 39 protein [Dehalococcoidia bacterium]